MNAPHSHALTWLAIFTPAWLPSLHDVSERAAELAPILGVVWLLLQIGFKVYDRKIKTED